MTKQAKTTLKNWFLTALKPLQQQYHDWMDSYWHKDELIPMEAVDFEIPDFPDPGVIETLIELMQPVVIEASGPVTVTMPAGLLLQDIVVLSTLGQEVTISQTIAGAEIAEAQTITASGWASWHVSIYNKVDTPLYFEAFSQPITIKLYYR
jgi:hypothetical protein